MPAIHSNCPSASRIGTSDVSRLTTPLPRTSTSLSMIAASPVSSIPRTTAPILAELSVDDMLHSRITDGGRLQFSATPATRMRVDEAAAQGNAKASEGQRLGSAKTQLADPEAELVERFEALEEAMAAEEQADAEASDPLEQKATK